MNVAIICATAIVAGAAGLAGIRGLNVDARPVAPASAASEQVKAEFAIDAGHSSIVYGIKHMGVGKFWGRFDSMSGKFFLDDAGTAVLGAEITVKAESVSTGIKNRDDHLKSADFFSVAEFPEITFKGASASDAGKDVLKGTITMLGKTVPVEAKITHAASAANPRGGTIGGLEARFTIKRSDFGMKYGIDNGALGDEVEMIVGLEGKKN